MKKAISVVLISTIIFATSVPMYAKSIKDLQQQQKNLDKQEKDIKNEISGVQVQKNTIFSEIQNLDVNINSVENELDRLDKQLVETEEKLSVSESELIQAQQEKEKQYEYLKKRIKFMYENGKTGYLEIFLNFKDFSSLLTRAEYVNDIIKYDNEMLEKMKETEETIKIKVSDIESEKKSIEILAKEQVNKKHSLEEAKEQKAQSIKKLEKDEAEYQRKLTEIENDDKEIERRINEAIEAARKAEEAARKAAEAARKAAETAKKAAENSKKATENSNKASQSSVNQVSSYTPEVSKYTGGAMLWPLPGHYTITSDYGYRASPFSGKRELHRGKDIAAPKGTKVLAASDGTVITSQYLNSYGNAIILDHGGGINTVYGHNSKLLVSVGTKVKKGQAIAQVGSTGDSTGNHLHFEVRVNGKCTSPDSYLK